MNSTKHFNEIPNLNLEIYNTDKISNKYLEKYAPFLAPWVGKKVALLELGILKGGSLHLWSDYFPDSRIVGIDLNIPEKFTPPENVRMYKGSQADTKLLTDVAKENAPDGFDIIIDDASHVGDLTKTAFWHLFDNHLKPGGLYVIEDWGTGYWNDWPDGKSLDLASYAQQPTEDNSLWTKIIKTIRRGLVKFTPNAVTAVVPVISGTMPNHSYGMVGFIKQLIDEQAASDVTQKVIKGKAERESKFKEIVITPSIVFIIKASELK